MISSGQSTPGSLETILGDILDRQREGATIDVDRLEQELKSFSRNEIVQSLKTFQYSGGGTFIAGRRGQPSRFLVKHYSRPAQPEPQRSATTDFGAPEPNHVLVLRRAPPLSLALPVDLTAEEVERIVRWVQALPTYEGE